MTEKNYPYVVRCWNPVRASEVGLGDGFFEKGDYVTYEGPPTKDINEACVYRFNDDDLGEFPFEESCGKAALLLEDYFEKIPVRVKIEPLNELIDMSVDPDENYEDYPDDQDILYPPMDDMDGDHEPTLDGN